MELISFGLVQGSLPGQPAMMPRDSAGYAVPPPPVNGQSAMRASPEMIHPPQQKASFTNKELILNGHNFT